MRWLLAHFCAVFAGAFIITSGVGAIQGGPEGFMAGATAWMGGLLIFLVIAIFTVPLGIGIRYLAGKLPLPPLPVALAIGVAIGLGLIPLLHPAMAPPLSFQTAPFVLVLLHAAAGALGGWVWYAVEGPRDERRKPVGNSVSPIWL